MSARDIGTALSSAVARMERNAAAGSSTALVPANDTPAPPPRIGIEAAENGAVMLPTPPALPTPPEAIRAAMSAAGAAALQPQATRGEDGSAAWVPAKAAPLTAPADVRAAAWRHAEGVADVLAFLPEDSLIQEWLGRWAPACARRGDQDYFGWEAGVLNAVRSVPAIAFCDATAERAGQSPAFKWLPTPPEVFALLTAFLQPWRDAEARARAVAAARDPEPLAVEAEGPRRLTREEADALQAERRASIAGALARFRQNTAAGTAMHAKMAGHSGEGRPKATPFRPLDLAAALMRDLSTSSARTRLDALARTYPEVADMLEANTLERNT